MSTKSYDDSRWASSKYLVSGTPSTPSENFIHYISCPPPAQAKAKGTIVLIHGWPQTSYQFRHVITPLADAGYTVIAPDYRGAGKSSKPREGYEKSVMAADIHALLTKHLGIKDKVHIVGHDIGGMIAHAYATRFAVHTASVALGECPLPATEPYDDFAQNNRGVWHFHFHWQADVPEMLTAGKERQYIKHFYDRLLVNAAAIEDEDVDHYAHMFERAGAMRAGFDVYRAFHKDVEENREWVKRNGKCKVPCLALSGAESFLVTIAEKQMLELYEGTETATVAGSGHYCAEENPPDFVRQVLSWVGKHETA